MKRGIVLFLSSVFICTGIPLFANTAITGTYGYFTIPITSTPSTGALHINTGYIFDPGNVYVSVNTAILNNWEISAGKEILAGEDEDIGATPYIFGTKYLFHQSGSFRASAGIQLELLGDEANVDGTPVNIYGVLSESAGNMGYINMGLGYTFGIDAEYAINFFVGLRRALIGDKLFVIGEFTNFSVRQGLGLPWNSQRGIFNAGLILELTDFLKFKFVTYDVLDEFLTVGLGGELRLKVF
jgi:hypothetical protein